MKRGNVSEFYCFSCLNKTIPIQRSALRTREKGHIKTMMCPFCKRVTDQLEVRENDFYSLEEFRKEVKEGVWENQLRANEEKKSQQIYNQVEFSSNLVPDVIVCNRITKNYLNQYSDYKVINYSKKTLSTALLQELKENKILLNCTRFEEETELIEFFEENPELVVRYLRKYEKDDVMSKPKRKSSLWTKAYVGINTEEVNEQNKEIQKEEKEKEYIDPNDPLYSVKKKIQETGGEIKNESI